MWAIILLEEVNRWFLSLAETDPEAAEAVIGAVDLLEAEGPALGRPAVDRVKGSTLHNMKELPPPSSSIRILFIFDQLRRAVLLGQGTSRDRGSSGTSRTSR